MFSKSLFFFVLLFLSLLMPLSTMADETIPEPLKQWVPWVLKGHEALKCPFINQSDYNNQKNHLCAWPGTFNLTASDNEGQFSQSWHVMEQSWLPLPGDKKNWPQDVKVNGKPAVVINHNRQPALFLPAGRYQVSGQFNWPDLPPSLGIPATSAVVMMTVNGKKIDFPKIESNALWLRELEVTTTEQDATDITVNRKISDGSYFTLDTRIDIDVSGKMREVKLGKVLPLGFKPSGIRSDISAFLDGDGVLHAKLKPGSWQITVLAYAQPTLLNWQRPEKTDLWPEQEIWTFAAQEQFRMGKLSGVKIIDTSLTSLPEGWKNLPGYVMSPTDVFNYAIQHRGKPLQLNNRLTLNRSMWLSYDTTQYTFNDNITGSMINGWRLSMPGPYLLESGEDQDGAVLITSLIDNERGIENRYRQVNIKAQGKIASTTELAVSGWDEHFEAVSLTLNLPPANRLLAVFGADSVSSSWLSSWTIWASFILLFSALLAGRVIGVSAGIITAVTLLLIYQENGSPGWAILNLLLAIAIAKYQPFPRLKSLARAYFILNLFAAVAAILYFSAIQLRSVIHPQLEARQGTSSSMFGFSSAADRIYDAGEIAQAEQAPSRQRQYAKQSGERAEDMQRIQVTGSRIKRSEALNERYQSNAILQAGAGIPNWQWHRYHINWTSPVAKGQQVSIVLLGPTGSALLKISGILLALLWLVSVLKPTVTTLFTPQSNSPQNNSPQNKSAQNQTTAAAILLLMLIPVGFQDVQANTLPSQPLLDELTKRVTEAPRCNPQCATFSNLHVDVQTNEMTLTMQVHVLADTAIALPKSSFWRPKQLLINGKVQQTLLKRKGWIYFPVTADALQKRSISTIKVIGNIAPVDQFQLRFRQLPGLISHNQSTAWNIIGIDQASLSGNTLEFIATAQKQQTDTVASSRLATRPFVNISRNLSIDQPWTVRTTVSRIAPDTGSVTVNVPLLSGEHITSGGIEVNDNQITVTIPDGQHSFDWQSTLDRQAQLTLTADTRGQSMEHWTVLSSPAWHVDMSDLPVIIEQQDNDDYSSTSFYPYDGESLTLDIRRPVAVKGQTLAIDRVESNLKQGKRTTTLTLAFDYRTTRGGEHIIELPEGYQLTRVQSDGRILNIQPDGLKLALPVSPGKHQMVITLRADAQNDFLLEHPVINLNAPVSNIESQVNLDAERWVLWTSGPVLGPAVIYWGELLVFMLLAVVLSKYPFSPLGTVSWLVLGIGLSLNHWSVLILVAVWFATLTASKYRTSETHRGWFNLSQLVLYGLSVTTLLTLVAAIPQSLLSTPDMGIVGNHSYDQHLVWFSDKSTGLLPPISVFSVPTLVYKGIMLLWVLWLSFSLLGWTRWAWQALGEQGYWRSKPVVIEPPWE